jgi:hypothetical protein
MRAVSLPRRSRKPGRSNVELHFSPSRHQHEAPPGFDLQATANSHLLQQEHSLHSHTRQQNDAFVIGISASGNGERGEFCRFSKFLLFCNESPGVRTTSAPTNEWCACSDTAELLIRRPNGMGANLRGPRPTCGCRAARQLPRTLLDSNA